VAWTSLSFTAAGPDAEAWSEALLEAGALSVEVVDAAAGTTDEVPQFGEPGEFEPGVWRNNRLSALFDESADVPGLVISIATERGWQHPVVYTLDRVEEQDWVRLTQSQFEPIRVSKNLWIVPSWRSAPDPSALNLIVDPGLAFGTGSHPTTRLCLRWIELHASRAESLLDYGCGSGILAIAAKKLGAGYVEGTDIDPQALESASSNASRNDVACRFVAPDSVSQRAFDVVVANILTNPLRLLAPALAQRVRPGGRILLSGILADQAQDVIDVYSHWFNITTWQKDEAWVALAGRRRQESPVQRS
jgi:ribosomal protein L11 methyltransferase